MSFFDEDDEPRRTPRPRRVRSSGGGTATADSQTVLIRRAVALVVGVLVLVLLIVAVNSCRNSQRENALKDYNSRVSTIGAASSQQVAQPFFQLLTEGAGDSPQDLQTAISGFRVQAEQQYEQAAGLDAPDEMNGAQQSALIALEWRRDGLDKIAQEIRTALGDEGEEATAAIESIAGQMGVFLASDVAWDSRVIPFIKTALDENEIGGQEIRRSPFLPDVQWTDPTTVASVLDQQLTSGGGAGGQPTGPGLHGTGLDSTAYGDTTLEPETTNRLTYEPGVPFIVTFTNQGENDEFDIRVTLRIQSEGGDPVTLSDTIPKLVPGESASAELPLEDQPPLDTAVTLRVNVAKVPGEEKLDNNRAEYPVLFERGE